MVVHSKRKGIFDAHSQNLCTSANATHTVVCVRQTNQPLRALPHANAHRTHVYAYSLATADIVSFYPSPETELNFGCSWQSVRILSTIYSAQRYTVIRSGPITAQIFIYLQVTRLKQFDSYQPARQIISTRIESSKYGLVLLDALSPRKRDREREFLLWRHECASQPRGFTPIFRFVSPLGNYAGVSLSFSRSRLCQRVNELISRFLLRDASLSLLLLIQ